MRELIYIIFIPLLLLTSCILKTDGYSYVSEFLEGDWKSSDQEILKFRNGLLYIDEILCGRYEAVHPHKGMCWVWESDEDWSILLNGSEVTVIPYYSCNEPTKCDIIGDELTLSLTKIN